ncbi:hypothetical protein [Dokdonia sp. Asnod2-E02]|uniref:hypothetical protein n=1 Tax=Dokdonia sp. Asnod2-E02 TaxID=3160574 RepID=UPI003865C2F6
MEVLQYQIGIAIVIFIACRINSKFGLIALIFCILFSFAMIHKPGLMILQLFTIGVSFFLFRRKDSKRTYGQNESSDQKRTRIIYNANLDRTGEYKGKSAEEIKQIKKKKQRKADKETIKNIINGLGCLFIVVLLYYIFIYALTSLFN